MTTPRQSPGQSPFSPPTPGQPRAKRGPTLVPPTCQQWAGHSGAAGSRQPPVCLCLLLTQSHSIQSQHPAVQTQPQRGGPGQDRPVLSHSNPPTRCLSGPASWPGTLSRRD